MVYFLSLVNVDLNYDEDLRAQQSKRFDVKSHFQIKCSVTGDDSVDAKWHKGSTEVKPSERVSTSKQGTVFSLNVKHATEEDAGNYECVVFKDDSEVKRANITLVSKVYVKMVANLNFVEGEAIKMVCQVVGSPTVTWMVGRCYRCYETTLISSDCKFITIVILIYYIFRTSGVVNWSC